MTILNCEMYGEITFNQQSTLKCIIAERLWALLHTRVCFVIVWSSAITLVTQFDELHKRSPTTYLVQVLEAQMFRTQTHWLPSQAFRLIIDQMNSEQSVLLQSQYCLSLTFPLFKPWLATLTSYESNLPWTEASQAPFISFIYLSISNNLLKQ